METTEPAFEASDPDAMGIDYERLACAQRRRVRAFLADSARYLGLTAAGSERRREGCRVRVPMPQQDRQLSAQSLGS